jgi:hypothetical protein
MSRTVQFILYKCKWQNFRHFIFYYYQVFFFFTIVFLLLIKTLFQNASANDEKIQKNCITQYLVFDVGSSTTKSILYKKDQCQGNKLISKQILNRNYPYQSCLSDSIKPGLMPQECIIGGVEIIQSIKKDFGVDCENDTQCYAVVTAWARNTANIQDWIDKVKKINVNPTIASQTYEGEIKINAMKKKFDAEDKKTTQDFIVFDIGGASFQLGWIDKNNHMNQYHGVYGTDNFTHSLQEEFLSENDIRCIKARNEVILVNSHNKNNAEYKEILQEVLHHEKRICSDYSITTIAIEDLNATIGYTRKIIGKSIIENKNLQNFIKHNKPILIGDSLLFNLGLRQQLGIDKDIITKQDILNVIKSLAGMKYRDIIVKYPKLPEICINTTQPAMIILYVVMESLNVDEIHIAQSDHTEQFLHQQISDVKH